jgi:hypothetical protein
VIAELEDAGRINAEDEIRAAREKTIPRLVRAAATDASS